MSGFTELMRQQRALYSSTNVTRMVLTDDLASYEGVIYACACQNNRLTFGYRSIGRTGLFRIDILKLTDKMGGKRVGSFTNQPEYYLGIIIGCLHRLHNILYQPNDCVILNYTAGESTASLALNSNITLAPDLLYFANGEAQWEFDKVLAQTPYYIDISWCVSVNPLFREIARGWKEDPTNSVFKWSLCG